MIRNRRNNKKLYLPAAMLGLIMGACSLHVDQTDTLETKGASDVFNGVVSPSGSLDNLYNKLTGEVGNQEEQYAMGEVTTDEMMVPTRGTDWGDNGVWRTLHAHTYGPTHRDVVNLWNNKNGSVLRANEIIDPLSKSPADIVAHAKFLRAYNMFLLMDAYGQVPYRNAADGPEIIPSVMTRKEAYDFITKDLTEALEALPASNPTATNKNRAVKAAARFLLAKLKINSSIYLGAPGASDYQDVISLVDAIEAEGYAITPSGTFFSIFKGPDYPNTDVIWAVPAGAGNRIWDGLHYNQSHTENTGGGWNGFTTLSEFYDKFEGPKDDNSIGLGQEERRGYTHTLASTNATNQGFGFGFQFGQMYGWKDGAAVALKTRTGGPLVFTKTLPGLIGNNEVTGIRLMKYSAANGAFVNGVVMMRFADAHLMRAEAKLRKGDAGSALADVNKLRSMRANTSPLASLGEAELLDERGRELYGEAWRRNDMIRFGTYKDAFEFKSADDGHTDLFPIPASAILSNPGLVQNPGY
jgi:hypothetical protein